MMKKLLILMLVLGLASLANAVATLDILGPGTGPGSLGDPLEVDEVLRLYIATDVTGLGTLSVTLTGSGSGVTLTGGPLKAEAADWGASVTYFTHDMSYNWAGGWQTTLSADSVVTGGTQLEIGLGSMVTIYGATSIPVVTAATDLSGSPYEAFYTPIAYIDLKGTGLGTFTLTMTDGSQFGTNTKMDDGTTVVTDFGSSVDVYGVPEPMTVLLLGLGGLFLRRRRK
jgi:hypothetical protein